jgi:hypothetical protein
LLILRRFGFVLAVRCAGYENRCGNESANRLIIHFCLLGIVERARPYTQTGGAA